jgi:hypothetical protein
MATGKKLGLSPERRNCRLTEKRPSFSGLANGKKLDLSLGTGKLIANTAPTSWYDGFGFLIKIFSYSLRDSYHGQDNHRHDSLLAG